MQTHQPGLVCRLALQIHRSLVLWVVLVWQTVLTLFTLIASLVHALMSALGVSSLIIVPIPAWLVVHQSLWCSQMLVWEHVSSTALAHCFSLIMERDLVCRPVLMVPLQILYLKLVRQHVLQAILAWTVPIDVRLDVLVLPLLTVWSDYVWPNARPILYSTETLVLALVFLLVLPMPSEIL